MEKYIAQFNNYFSNSFIYNFPEIIHEKIHYLLEDGKRIRPILFIVFSGVVIPDSILDKNKIETKLLLDIACIIELIHNISLIIDDFPEMDNDTLRRNKPAFHIKYGYEYSKFFIFYLLNKLNIILTNINIDNARHKIDNYIRDIIYLIRINLTRLIDGQFIDLEVENTKKSLQLYDKFIDYEEDLVYGCIINFAEMDNEIKKKVKPHLIYSIFLNIRKTGSLFHMAILTGFLFQLHNANIIYNLDIPFYSSLSDKSNVDNSKSLQDIITVMENILFNNKTKTYKSINKILKEPKTVNNLFSILSLSSNLFGFLFQISDDIIDIDIDKKTNKPNICNHLTEEITRKTLDNGCVWLDNVFKEIHKKIKSLYNTTNGCINNINIGFDCNIICNLLEKIKNRKE
jgi:geranylgeranyl pyrophosphate synthase